MSNSSINSTTSLAAPNATTATQLPTTATPQDLIIAINVIFYYDKFIEFSSTFVHLFYFFMITQVKSMRSKGMLYVHHANVISFVFNTLYIVYWNWLNWTGMVDSVSAYRLCYASDILWSYLKNLRNYAISLIAYRFIK